MLGGVLLVDAPALGGVSAVGVARFASVTRV